MSASCLRHYQSDSHKLLTRAIIPGSCFSATAVLSSCDNSGTPGLLSSSAGAEETAAAAARLLRRRSIQIRPNKIAARATIPPTTPPAMAPVFVPPPPPESSLSLVGVGVGSVFSVLLASQVSFRIRKGSDKVGFVVRKAPANAVEAQPVVDEHAGDVQHPQKGGLVKLPDIGDEMSARVARICPHCLRHTWRKPLTCEELAGATLLIRYSSILRCIKAGCYEVACCASDSTWITRATSSAFYH